jgi:hypothetical protein
VCTAERAAAPHTATTRHATRIVVGGLEISAIAEKTG